MCAYARPGYQKLRIRVIHMRDNRRGQPNRSAMEGPHPGGTAFVITVTPMPAKHHLRSYLCSVYLRGHQSAARGPHVIFHCYLCGFAFTACKRSLTLHGGETEAMKLNFFFCLAPFLHAKYYQTDYVPFF
ncbi:AAEL017356-PA [Aedes aegypti]|uniref:AAEL017356-PA n=1 Tax=Aedes aegypti TaxID=7159 RepID=J9HHQ0_AEDAE|nr:AAEL017356-PA [Aedes aegypti]